MSVWYRLKRCFKMMGNATDWMDGDSEEPDWPGKPKPKPKLHLCEGCDRERPVDTFEAVDTMVGGNWTLLVRCDDCRAVKPLTTPFDSRT